MKRVHGFTLVELLITITILAILVAMAAPSFMKAVKKYERDNTLSILATLLHEARLIALLERKHVVVCPTPDGFACSKSSPKKIMSFIDSNKNKKRDNDEQVFSSQSIDLTFGEITFNMSARRSYIRYYPNTGTPRGHFGNIKYCPEDNDTKLAKSVIMNNFGRARFSFDSNNDGVHDNGRGGNLTCP